MTIIPLVGFLLMCVAFFLEEFVLIKPVSTIGASDPLSRRLETLAIWAPALGIALCGATVGRFGGLRAHGTVNAIGLLLCVTGLVIRYWARKVLGRFFTIGVVRQEGHTVIRTGPYRRVRHPAYLAFLLFYLGLPLVAGNWLALGILTAPAVVIFLALVVVEDRRLEEELGAPYAAYKAESARLLPGLW